MPKVFTSEKQKIGELGESIACRFLVKQGFTILERNYTKKWGEIDIVAQQGKRLYFVEVKSVSRKTLEFTSPWPSPGKGEGKIQDYWRPEDNMHPWKLKRLSRTIQTYLVSKRVPDSLE